MNLILPLVLFVSGVIGQTLSDEESRYDAYRRSGLTALLQANYKQAENDLKNALVEARIIAPSDRRVATSLGDLGVLYAKTRRLHEAEELLQQSVTILQTNDPKHTLSIILNTLGQVYSLENRVKEAERTLSVALSLAKNARGPMDDTVADILTSVGALQLKQRHYHQAEQSLQRSLEIRQRTPAAENFCFADTLDVLGTLYMLQLRYSRAEDVLERSLKIAEAHLPPDHPDLAPILENLAVVENKLHHFESAETYFRRTIAIQTPKLAMSRPALIAAYADTLRNLNRQDEATVLLERRKLLLDQERFIIKVNRP